MSFLIAAYIFAGVTFTLDAAVFQIKDPVGAAGRLDIVGNHHYRLAFVIDIRKNIQNRLHAGRVQRTCRQRPHPAG